MAYYETQYVQPIAQGGGTPVGPAPASGIGCAACAASASGLGFSPVAVSGLGATSDIGSLLAAGAVGAAAVSLVAYLAARASSSSARAGEIAKYGAFFGAFIGAVWFSRPTSQALPVEPASSPPVQP